MRKENTDHYIENTKDEMISEIIKLVSFPSINGQKKSDPCLSRILLETRAGSWF